MLGKFRTILSLFVGFLLGAAATGADQAEVPKAPPASPFSPEESRQHFQLDPDCQIELAAAEPDVSAPVSIAFDEKGQMWVVEMHDYPNGPAPGEPGKSRIRVLSDEDADGRYSNPRIFVDQLLFANSLMHWDGGVLVTTNGQLIYFKDTDHDGKADFREVWFEGFATENPQLRCNHPTLGPDNWIYVANGLRNGKVRAVRPKWPQPAPTGIKLGEPVDISGRDFRFNPFTGECEAVSGYGQFGLTFDDEGNRYVCSNRNPCMKVLIEEWHLKLNPNLAVPSVVDDVEPAGEKSKLHPISRAWTTSNLHAGQFSAACGLIFYRGTALTEKFYNKSFTCDPTGNLVHFNNAHYNESKHEFLASDETWFRPVNTAMGPDGALYVVDMYRAVIEHPEYMPAELKTRPDLSLGAERGRIWRLVAQTKNPDDASLRSISLPTDPVEIAKLVAHPNGWHRDMAQRLIVEQKIKLSEPSQPNSKERSAVSSAVEQTLRSALLHVPADQGSVVALRTLRGLGWVTDADLATILLNVSQAAPILSQPDGERTSHTTQLAVEALQQAFERLATSELLQEKVVAFGLGPHPSQVAFPLHLALGQLGEKYLEERVRMATQDLHQATGMGVILGVAAGERPILSRVMSEPTTTHLQASLLLDTAIRGATPEELANILGGLLNTNRSVDVLRFAQGARSRGVTMEALIESRPELRDAWEKLLASAAQTVRDRQQDGDPLLLSIQFLRYADPETALPILRDAMNSELPADIMQAVISVITSMPDPEAIDCLLLGFPQRTPALRSLIISGLLASDARIAKLLDLAESSQISFLEIGQTRLTSLQQVKNPEIQERLKKLIAANAPADRSQVIEEYQAALKMESDPLRGRELFAKNCSQCHKIGDLGIDVAPNISDSRVKTHEQLLVDILDPNRAIDNNYFSYTLIDTNGTVSTGVISSETSSSVTLKQPEGKTLTVLRSEIELLKPNGVSLMPVGFEKQLTVAQLGDLISFVKNWRYLDGQVPKEVIK